MHTFLLTYVLAFISILDMDFYEHSDSSFSIWQTFAHDFKIGAALNGRDVMGNDPIVKNTLLKHFNSISPENLLKWQSVHPAPGNYNFNPSDAFVNLGKELNAFIIGHTLVWHNQTPSWVFINESGEFLDREGLTKRMEDHISTVLGRYKGSINGWDVVNEAFTDNGTYRKSHWYNIIGQDFIPKAFKKAHEVDPDAELYYNDYNLWKPEKIDAAVAMAASLKEQGIRIDGIGMQGHYGLTSPSLEQIEASILKIADLGLKVMITELDIDVLPNPTNRRGADIDDNFEYEKQYDPYQEGFPEEIREALAQRYYDLFALFEKHKEVVTRVTLWGIRDQDSWLNNWPIRGRTAYPLLFENDYRLKSEIELQFRKFDDK
ncbi:endo-1,4-beta-xylanase [Echinicola sp. 20G]|uniref:endo-1,4-beta-xylanase n=1 Tax=Echinicola sp. 20G TaxID=2781961 RepID=UPI0019100686|nr:endo-1,4-beta-xylanase [Echinicola sp. 20G]